MNLTKEQFTQQLLKDREKRRIEKEHEKNRIILGCVIDGVYKMQKKHCYGRY